MYIPISWFLAFLKVRALAKVLMYMLVCLVLIISRLHSHLQYFPTAIFIVPHTGAPSWKHFDEYLQFGRTYTHLGEASSLFIYSKITISWLRPLNNFRFIFVIAWQWKRSVPYHPGKWTLYTHKARTPNSVCSGIYKRHKPAQQESIQQMHAF